MQNMATIIVIRHPVTTISQSLQESIESLLCTGETGDIYFSYLECVWFKLLIIGKESLEKVLLLKLLVKPSLHNPHTYFNKTKLFFKIVCLIYMKLQVQTVGLK